MTGFEMQDAEDILTGESAHWGLSLARRHALMGVCGAGSDPGAFQETVNRASIADYRRMTRNALSAALWYKRYAQSVLDVDAAEADPGEGA